MTIKKPIVYKIVFMGDSGVGKSSIAERIVYDTFNIATEATIGASYFSKTIYKGDQSYNFNIWDTAGQEKYNCLVPLYYRNCDAAIIVYDITNRTSYQNALNRIPELRKNSTVETIMLIGNKTDLVYDRNISTEDATADAEQNNVLFMETSAKISFKTREILENMLEHLPVPEVSPGEKKSLSIESIIEEPTHSCCYY